MANEGLWEQLLALGGAETARRAQCQYSEENNRHTILLMNKEYVVNLSEKRVVLAKDSSEASFGEELCILAYLINSEDLPIAGKLAPAESLPGGQFFFRGLHKLPTEKLEEAFGKYPERLYEVMHELAGKRRDFGDAAVEFDVFPRVPLTVVLWRADDEFPARASILFDETAASQMPLDALGLAVNLAVKALVKASAKGE